MMRFAGLGLINSLRNLNRSLMTLAAMAIAGLMMTASMSVQQGYLATEAFVYRAFLGGDILVYPGRVLVDAAHLSEEDGPAWTWQRNGGDIAGPLAYFHPDARHPGHVLPLGQSRGFARTAQDYHALVEQIQSVPGVARISPYWTIPVPVLWYGPPTGYIPPRPTYHSVLRARDVVAETELAGLLEEFDLMVSGRYFRPEDDGQMVAVVDAGRKSLDRTDMAIGQVLQLVVPRPFRDHEGIARFDYTNTVTVELSVIGLYMLPSRSLVWEVNTPAGPAAMHEQLFFITPEIIVPVGTMEKIVNLAAGVSDMAQVLSPAAILVTVDNFGFVEDVASQLQEIMPGASVTSVPREMARVNMAGLPEPINEYPEHLRPVHRPEDLYPGQWGRPVDVSPMLNGILFLVAALVAATNATILVLERRRELGVLKAVGARNQDIMVMVMAEVMALAFTGATLGFLLVRMYGSAMLVSTGTSWRLIAQLAWKEWAMVLGVTGSVSLVFSLIPALSTLRMTASEVLRLQ